MVFPLGMRWAYRPKPSGWVLKVSVAAGMNGIFPQSISLHPHNSHYGVVSHEIFVVDVAASATRRRTWTSLFTFSWQNASCRATKTALTEFCSGESHRGFGDCTSLSEIACQAVINLSSYSFKSGVRENLLRG